MYVLPKEYPRFKNTVPTAIPPVNPNRPMIAFQSPPAKRKIIRNGHPKKIRQPIIVKNPKVNRVAGAEPPLAALSPRNQDNKKAPNTNPIISGRMYCTGAALCRPKPPTESRMKQAIQKPIFCGFPASTNKLAIAPIINPAIIILCFSLITLIVPLLLNITSSTSLLQSLQIDILHALLYTKYNIHIKRSYNYEVYLCR